MALILFLHLHFTSSAEAHMQEALTHSPPTLCGLSAITQYIMHYMFNLFLSVTAAPILLPFSHFLSSHYLTTSSCPPHAPVFVFLNVATL